MRLIALMAAALCYTAEAVEIRLAAGKWTGTARVTITVAADGTQTVTIDGPVTVTGLAGTPGPQPDPPPDPPPVETPLDKFRGAVRAATTVVSDPNKAATQTALAKLYSTVAGLPVTDRQQLVQATDILFSALGLPAAWQSWKGKVDAASQPFTAIGEARAAWQAISEGVKP